MIDLACGVVAVFVVAALGACVLRGLRAVPTDARDRLLWMAAVGFGAWGVLGLALAAAHFLRAGVVIVVACAAVVAGGRPVWEAIRDALDAPRRRRLGIALAPAITLTALTVVALAPVVTGDQTKYQLAYPKLYAEAGGLVATPWTFWGNQQFLQNFAFAVAYAVRGERLALLMGVVWLLLAAGALARLVDRHLWRGAGGTAAALLITVPIAWSLASKAGADLSLLTYTTLGVTAFLDWRRATGTRAVAHPVPGEAALRRCALAAGLAGGTKVMGLLTPALLGAGVLAVAWRRLTIVPTLRAVLLVGVLAGGVAAPPYVRNWVETGNPLYPFAVSVFGGRGWSVAAGRYLNEYYRQYQVERAARRAGAPYRGIELWRFPWDATMVPESFERAARQSLDVGPFALAFLPAALWWATRRPTVAWTLGLGVAYASIIAGAAWAHPRYVLPGVGLVLASAVAGVRALGGRWLPAVVGVTLAGHLVVTSRLVVPEFPDQLRVAVGSLSRDEYLERHSERYRFWRRACPVVGTTGVVMVLEKIPHPYFIECRFVLASYLEQALIDYRRVTRTAELQRAAEQMGVTHVAVSRTDLARHADSQEAHATALWRAWTAGLGAARLEVDSYALYAMPAAPGAAGP